MSKSKSKGGADKKGKDWSSKLQEVTQTLSNLLNFGFRGHGLGILSSELHVIEVSFLVADKAGQ